MITKAARDALAVSKRWFHACRDGWLARHSTQHILRGELLQKALKEPLWQISRGSASAAVRSAMRPE